MLLQLYVIITDRGRSLTILTRFKKKRKNMHTVDISSTPYLPCFVNIATLTQEKNLEGPKGQKMGCNSHSDKYFLN